MADLSRKKTTYHVPHALDLEESVLGALLIEGKTLPDVIDILKPTSFYAEQHVLIYETILKLFSANSAIDLRTVINQLRKDKMLKKAGGTSYVVSLTKKVASAGHIEDHARIMVEYAIRRAVIDAANNMKNDAEDESVEAFALLDKAEQTLFDISQDNLHKDYSDLGTLLQISFKEIETRKEKQSSLLGVPTGFIELDRFTMGWQKSDFVVLAARPGMGKTSLLLAFLRNAAVDHQVPVAFFSLEMSSIQLVNRILAAESGIDGEKIKRSNLEEYEWQQLYHKTNSLAKAPIFIDDTPKLSIFELRAKCRRLKYQKNVQVVFLDYLQLMGDESNRSFGNREQQIASISRSIKATAKELDITFVVASQLSRSVETRGGDKRPQLSDLRESGAIEQDADMVIFPYRPIYYGITQDNHGNDTKNLAQIIIAKHRNGPTGEIPLTFLPSITKFTDLAQKTEFLESKMNAF